MTVGQSYSEGIFLLLNTGVTIFTSSGHDVVDILLTFKPGSPVDPRVLKSVRGAHAVAVAGQLGLKIRTKYQSYRCMKIFVKM